MEQRPLHLQWIVHCSLFFAHPHDSQSLFFDLQVHLISCNISFGAGALFASDEKHYFLFLSFLGSLGPNYYIWELGYFCTPKHVFSHILVKNNDLIEVEGLLEAYWQDDSDEKHYF